jgi:ubiquinone/menaquinone biosynthesis C-methylase UbiE
MRILNSSSPCLSVSSSRRRVAIASTACLPQTCSPSSQALNCGVSGVAGDVATNLTLPSGQGHEVRRGSRRSLVGGAGRLDSPGVEPPRICNPDDGLRFFRDATEVEEHAVSEIDSTRKHLIETYRKKAKHYDRTSRFFPVPGYPQRGQRLRAVQALGLRPGDTVVEIACGTGLNFSLIQQAIGPEGRIVGVDLTDAMLAQAQHRVEANGWSNVSLVQSDAAEFDFPTEVDAILSTYALTQVPGCADVIAHGAEALSRGGRWVVLDLKVPGQAPRPLAQLGIALARQFGSVDEWVARRPWEAIRAAMQESLTDPSWTELFFGSAFLAAGSRGPRTVDEPPRGSG